MVSSRLEEMFRKGVLVDPSGGGETIVDLICAIAAHFGAPSPSWAASRPHFQQELAAAEHVVLVLVDGLGMNLLGKLDPAGFFRSSFSRELRALAPSTTACVLTSLATGVYPADHGITGWFTHLPEFERTVLPLPWIDRGSRQPLPHFGIRPDDLFPLQPLMPGIRAESLCLMPTVALESPFSIYGRGGAEGAGYDQISQAVDQVLHHFQSAHSPTFTYLYIPHIDDISHNFGPLSKEAISTAGAVETELQRLVANLPPEARFLATADHGQIHIPPEGQHLLSDNDELLERLIVPPSGEARFPLFHVKPGQGDAFAASFQERFGSTFELLSMAELERLRIFGPGPLSPQAKRHFGDFGAIPLAPVTLDYLPTGADPSQGQIGRHGGLAPEEMRVPLFLQGLTGTNSRKT